MDKKSFEKYFSKASSSTKHGALIAHKASSDELGPLYSLFGEGRVPESQMRLVIRHVLSARAREDYPESIDYHSHDVPQTYILLSEGDEALQADFIIEGESYELSSPGAVYVPPGLVHRIQLKAGRGYVIVMMPITNSYNNHTFPHKPA